MLELEKNKKEKLEVKRRHSEAKGKSSVDRTRVTQRTLLFIGGMVLFLSVEFILDALSLCNNGKEKR